MLKWDFIEVFSGYIMNDEKVGKFDISADESYIYFKRKHYNIISVETTETNTIYKTECVRHTGKRHVKYETMFVVTPQAVGYCESLFVEV